ncbi:MAG: SDR family oxidoreductase [Acidimicrobiales bacterium]
MKVAVIGATGYVGGRLVPELLTAGHDVRCLARNPDRLAGVDWRSDVEVVAADVLDQCSLEEALVDIEAVYYLVHAMGHAGDFEHTDRVGAENTKNAAERAGLSRIIYLGGLGEEDPDKLSPHLASRHEVGQVLASGTVPVTELRAAVIIGSGSASFEMLRHLDEVLPVMICPRWVTKTRCQPIGIADVLHYLVAVIDEPRTAGQILEIGGPDVLTYRDMMDRYAAIAGLRRRLIIPVPLLTPRLSSHWVNLVTPLPYGLARPLVDSLINDVVVHPDRDVRRLIDYEPHTLDEAIERALARVGDLEIRTSWMDSAPTSTPASPMPQDPEWAGATIYQNIQEVTTTVDPAALFATVSGIGGERGWYVARPLWTLRGWLDKLIGGVGMRRGRRHSELLRVGDALDFFRVESYEPPKLLRLRAEMKVPGEAWLEWRITDNGPGSSQLRQLARFHPRGVAGRAYWWVLLPIHKIIWRQLAQRLADSAEPSTTEPGPAPRAHSAGEYKQAR